DRLRERLADRVWMEIAEHVLERKRVRRVERKDEALFGRGCLQLEVETLAELLPERQPPRLVDAAAERRVEDELHAARFVEEAFQCDLVHCGDETETALGFAEVGCDLLGGDAGEEIIAFEKLNGWVKLAILAG